MTTRISAARGLPLLSLIGAFSLFPSVLAAAPKTQKPIPAISVARDLSPADAVMLHWEEEAIRRGRMVCTNPAHHHVMSAQLHMLREDDESDNVRRDLR